MALRTLRTAIGSPLEVPCCAIFALVLERFLRWRMRLDTNGLAAILGDDVKGTRRDASLRGAAMVDGGTAAAADG
jgi:hypothetical protein